MNTTPSSGRACSNAACGPLSRSPVISLLVPQSPPDDRMSGRTQDLSLESGFCRTEPVLPVRRAVAPAQWANVSSTICG
eukprot:scaffold20766_cov118-Isochrysis_galbana.AAC.3